jgi:hypothetical protein
MNGAGAMQTPQSSTAAPQLHLLLTVAPYAVAARPS